MKKCRLICLIIIAAFCLMLAAAVGCIRNDPGADQNNYQDTEEVSAQMSVQPPVKKLTKQDLELLPPDIRRIKEKGILTVAMFWQDRPSFFYTDEQGDFVGIDVSLAQDIAKWLEVELAFDRQARSFDEVVERVATGQADIAISKLSVTLSRAQKVLFSEPYVTFNQALLVNRIKLTALEAKQPGSTPLDIICGSTQKIGVRKGTSYQEYGAILFPNSVITPYDEMEDLFAAVQEGEILAAFYDEFELRSALNKNPRLSLYAKLFVIKDRVDPIAMAVAPQDKQLLAWLNIYLDIMKQDLQIEQLLDKHSGGAK